MTSYRQKLKDSLSHLSRRQQFAQQKRILSLLSWCSRRSYDPFKLPTKLILKYLKDVFQEKESHTAVNTARSALSFYLERREGMRIGELPDIDRLCIVSARLHPSQPRYHSTWDVNQMLVYIGTLDHNDNISLGKLINNLTMLLALATCGRTSDLLSYHTHLMEWSISGIALTRNFRGKSSGAGKRVFFPSHDKEALCILKCLR